MQVERQECWNRVRASALAVSMGTRRPYEPKAPCEKGIVRRLRLINLKGADTGLPSGR
jgi:hypothetical protein